MNRDRIPPLELAFRVAQLGGWENVELLTYTTLLSRDPTWIRLGGIKHVQLYMDPDAQKHWHVFDVRKQQ